MSIINELKREIRNKSGILAIHDDKIVPLTQEEATYQYQISGSHVNMRTNTVNLQQKILETQLMALKAEATKKIETHE